MPAGRRLGLIAAALAAGILLAAPSPSRAQSVDALSQRAMQLYNAGKYADALPLVQRVLELRQKQLGPDHPGVADTLDMVAALDDILGRPAEAEPLYQRSLAIRQKAYGQVHPDVAASLINLGVLYRNQGRSGDAETTFKQALAIREKLVGTDHPDVGAVLNNLALIYREQGRYREAEPLYRRALAIQEKASATDHRDITAMLINLAELYRIEGRAAEAEPLYRRGLDLREQAFGPDHPAVGQALNNLALLYIQEGRSADAEALLKRALAIREKAFGAVHRDVALALGNLAGLYLGQQRFAEAQPLAERALAIRQQVLGVEHPEVAASLENLALIYEGQGRLADAEPLLARAVAIREKALGPDHPDLAAVLDDLAELHHRQGRDADAEPLEQRALVLRQKALGPDHRDVAQSLNNLAEIYAREGRIADALPLVQTVEASGRARTSAALPVLSAARDQGLISATAAMDGALDVVQRAAQTSAAAAVNKLAVRLAAGSDRLAELVRRDQDLAGEGDALDKSMIAAVSKEPGKRDASGEQRMRDRMAAIAGERGGLQQTFAAEFPDYAALSNPKPLSAKEIAGLLSDDEALVAWSTLDNETYVFAETRLGFGWTKLPLGAAALADKVAALRRGLDVDMVADKSVLDALNKKRELFDLALAYDLYAALFTPVEALIKDKRRLIVAPTGALTALPFHLLVTAPPAQAVPSAKDKLGPDDFALYRDAAWLAKRQAVSVLPSVVSLKVLRQGSRANRGAKPLVGFGDPIFDPAERGRAQAELRGAQGRAVVASRTAVKTRAYTDFWQGAGLDRSLLARALPSLLDTADELNAVAAEVGAAPADIHLDAAATESNVKQLPLADYRVVYFATHGLVAGDVKDVAEPALALTIPKEPSDLDDGLLTASEAAQLKLNADWVVLSACNTAAGDKPGADALSGLARAFFYAGARALLVSHWPVESQSATRLTTATFDLLKSQPGLGRAEALRRAMVAYLGDTARPQNAYPAYWGPFAVVGEGTQQ